MLGIWGWSEEWGGFIPKEIDQSSALVWYGSDSSRAQKFFILTNLHQTTVTKWQTCQDLLTKTVSAKQARVIILDLLFVFFLHSNYFLNTEKCDFKCLFLRPLLLLFTRQLFGPNSRQGLNGQGVLRFPARRNHLKMAHNTLQKQYQIKKGTTT